MNIRTNGPEAPAATIPFGEVEIPVQLLEAHARGEVVFFVGSGVSVPAGLPDFLKLVKELRDNLTDPSYRAVVTEAMEDKFLDRAIHLIDTETADGRDRVRLAIAKRLLKARTKTSIERTLHSTLLSLATRQPTEGPPICRLVTTNQDRLFEIAARQNGRLHDRVPVFAAPALPVAKRGWSGRVYLHGLLEDKHKTEVAQDLVFSSADFGRAYLTDQWAANFVRELSAGHSVVFVGYSLDDPILRYVGDALAAGAEANWYAFAPYDSNDSSKPSSAADATLHWFRRGVCALPFPVKPGYDYSALTEALETWAELSKDDIALRKRIIDQYAPNVPDNALAVNTRLVLWALDEPTGLVAKHFASIEPAPPTEWAPYFLGSTELTRHGGANLLEEGKLIHEPLLRPVKVSDRATVAVAPRAAYEWPSNKQPYQLQLEDWMIRHADDDRMAYLLLSAGSLVSYGIAARIHRRFEEPDFPPHLRVAYELWMEGYVEIPTHTRLDFGWPNNRGDGLSRSTLRRTLYDAMRLRLSPNLEDHSRYYREQDESSGSPANPARFHLRLQIIDQRSAFLDPKYATAHEVEDDPLLFCRKAEGILLLDAGLLDSLEAAGLYLPDTWHRRSLDSLNEDQEYSYSYLLPVLAMREAVRAVLPRREEEVNTEALHWLRLPALSLQLLGAWALTQAGHLDWSRTIETLYEPLPRGTTRLFDSDYWLEIAKLLAAFAKTGYTQHPEVASKLESAILTAPSLPFPNAERTEELVNYDRYQRLRAIEDGGGTLGEAATAFARRVEAEDEQAKAVADRQQRERDRGTDGGVIRGRMVPRDTRFTDSSPDEWAELLIEFAQDDYDDWFKNVQEDPVAAFKALALAEQTKPLPGGRWSSLLHSNGLGALSNEQFGQLLDYLSNTQASALREMSWALGAFFWSFPRSGISHLPQADELLLRAAPYAYTPEAGRDFDRGHGAVTLTYGAVGYLLSTYRAGARDTASLIDLFNQLSTAFQSAGDEVDTHWHFDLTRGLDTLAAEVPTISDTYLYPAIALQARSDINTAVWQGVGLHLPYYAAPETYTLIRPHLLTALQTIPGEQWKASALNRLTKLTLLKHENLVPPKWFGGILAAGVPGVIELVLEPLAWHIQYADVKQRDSGLPSGAALWTLLSPFFAKIFPKSGTVTRGQMLTGHYLYLILYAGERAAEAAEALKPYLTALPYLSNEGQRVLMKLDEFADEESIRGKWKGKGKSKLLALDQLPDAAPRNTYVRAIRTVLDRVFVDPRYRGEEMYRGFLRKLATYGDGA